MADVLGQKIKAVTELLKIAKQKEGHGCDTATCYLRNDVIATGQELQQNETHEGRRQPWSRDPVNGKLVETDDGERGKMWREHHGNIAESKDDRGSTTWELRTPL